MAESFVCVNGIDRGRAAVQIEHYLEDELFLDLEEIVDYEWLANAVIAAALGECIPATVEKGNDVFNNEWVTHRRFVSAWQPVKVEQ